MAIAIDHHHIAWGYCVVPHHFVGGAGAVGHKETMVCIENAGGIAFAFTNGAIVIKQLTQLFHGIANVGTQHVFTIKLVVHLTHRALQERHTA